MSISSQLDQSLIAYVFKDMLYNLYTSYTRISRGKLKLVLRAHGEHIQHHMCETLYKYWTLFCDAVKAKRILA